MAQNVDQIVSCEQQTCKGYNFHLRDKAYLDAELSDVNFLFYEPMSPSSKQTGNVIARKIVDKVPAHKLILALGSKVFRTEFYGSLKEKDDVEIVDSSPEAFKEFLQCFYLGSGTFKMENIAEVMYLADKYDVSDCMNACIRFLKDNLTTEDLCSGYSLAILYNLQDLKQFCEPHIVLNANVVLKSDEFLNCDHNVLREILQLNLWCEETIVFDSCLNWARKACQKKELDENIGVNLRNQLGDCVYFIHFGTIAWNEISERILKYSELLTTTELEDVLHSKSLVGFVSKKFNQKTRLHWDESQAWKCRPPKYSETFIKSREIVHITTNRNTILGKIHCSNGLNAKISIMEIKDKSFDSQTGKIIFTATMTLSSSKESYIKLPTPILISEGITYQICFDIINHNDRCRTYNTKSDGEVKSQNGLIITFNSGNAIRHLISCLELMDH